MKASILVALSIVIATSARGQAPNVSCDSAALRAPVGMQLDTMRVFLRRADLSAPLPSTWALAALDGLRQGFIVPPNLAFAAYVGGREPGTATVTARSTLLFDARSDGTAKIRGMLSRSGSDALDASLAAGVMAAGSQRAFAPFPPTMGREISLVAELFFGVGDSLRAGMDVAELQLPVYRNFSGALPATAADSTRDARSLVQAIAIIEAQGTVRRGSVDLYTLADPSYAAQLLDRLKGMTAQPARVAGCAVPTLLRFVMEPPSR